MKAGIITREVCLKNHKNYTNGLNFIDVEIILDDIEFAWSKKQIAKVIQMWRNGRTLSYMQKELKRDPDEIFLLLFHLSRNGKIENRENYIWGDRQIVKNE